MSAAFAAAAAASASAAKSINSNKSRNSGGNNQPYENYSQTITMNPTPVPSRYESQKRRDWITFCEYLKNQEPPLVLSLCNGEHVVEFLRFLDQFGETKVHTELCPFFGHLHPPAPCPCPLRQAWRSLDAIVRRLRAAYEEDGGRSEMNPFGAPAVSLYLDK